MFFRRQAQAVAPTPVEQTPAVRLEDIYGNHPDDKITGGSQIFYWNEFQGLNHVPTGRRYYDKDSVVYQSYRAIQERQAQERQAQEESSRTFLQLFVLIMIALMTTAMTKIANVFKDGRRTLLAAVSFLLVAGTATAFVFSAVSERDDYIKQQALVIHQYKGQLDQALDMNKTLIAQNEQLQTLTKHQGGQIGELATAVSALQDVQQTQIAAFDQLRQGNAKLKQANARLMAKIHHLEQTE